MPSNCGAGEDSWKQGQQGAQTLVSILREINPEYSWKDWCWSWSSSILVIWCEQTTHCKIPEAGKDWGQGEEGIRGWDGWTASLMQWTWTWANSGRWWGTGSPAVLLSFGSQRIGHDWATELNWTILGHSRCYIVVVVQSPSRVWLFVTQRTACQASLSITNSRSSLRLTSIESVMPSSHLTLCRPLLLLPPIPPSIRVFSNESTLRMRWPKYWSFSFSFIPSKEIPGLISFRIDWQKSEKSII